MPEGCTKRARGGVWLAVRQGLNSKLTAENAEAAEDYFIKIKLYDNHFA
jgi:hypothetical protein